MALTKILAIATAAVIGATASSQAAMVNLETQDPGGSAFGTPSWAENVTRTIDGNAVDVGAGLFRLRDSATLEDLLAFCIEPEVFLDLNQSFDTMITAAPWASKFTDIDKLFTSSYDQIVDAATAAGFQLALWEIIRETSGTLDITGGTHFSTGSAGALAAANTFLAALATAGTGGYKYTTYVNDGQDLISVAPVPVPAAALLFAPALAGMAMRKKRKA